MKNVKMALSIQQAWRDKSMEMKYRHLYTNLALAFTSVPRVATAVSCMPILRSQLSDERYVAAITEVWNTVLDTFSGGRDRRDARLRQRL